jgi:hypothetical protein
MTVPTLLIAFDGSASAAAAVRVAGALFPGAPAPAFPHGAGISGPAPAVDADDREAPGT